MSVTIGRASLDDLYDLRVRGNRVSFRTDIEGADVYEMKALRQQLAGLADNRDETVVPFTWSEDATLDGFYRVVGTSIGSSDVMLSTGFVPEVDVELEQIPGFANPWFEVTTQSVVRTNGHSVTTPSGVVAHSIVENTYTHDLRPSLTSASSSSLLHADGGTNAITIYKATAPVALTSYRFSVLPAAFYYASCRLELSIGGTWYPMVGRQIPEGYQWRISNGIVRLTAASGAAADGTFEAWDNTTEAWESQDVAHWTTSALGPRIGLPTVTGQPPRVSVLRNSPEQVAVRAAGNNYEMDYSIQRGARHVSASFTSATAATYGAGFGAASIAASTSFTGGIARTSNDANGNRMIFGTAAAASYSTTNGAAWLSSAATSGSMWWGIDLAGAGVTTVRRDEFMAVASMCQRVVVR